MTPSKIRSSSQLFVDADLDIGTHKILGVSAPTLGSDAANKTYVDGILKAQDAMVYKGVIDASSNPNYPAADAGDTYKISVGGKVGGASGDSVSAGDLIVCTLDGSASGTKAAVGANWDVIHVNAASGSVTSTAASPLDNQIVRLDSTTGTIVQNSLATIDDAGSINIPAGQAFKVNGVAVVNYTHPNHTGDVTSTGDGATVIANSAVTLAKMANLAQNTIIGRITGSTGVPEALTAANVRTILNVADGANNYVHPNHSGDVTSVADGATTIAAGAVTLAKMANMATASLIYRKTAGTGAPEVQTLATLKTDLAFTPSDIGAVPTTRTVNGKALSADITLGLASADFVNQGTTSTVLHGNGAGNPSFGAVVAADIGAKAVTLAKMDDVATGTIFYRKTAATGVPEVQTLATLKTDLGLTGTNSGDMNYVTREVPSGAKNGANATFTLASTPVVGSESLYLNGMLLNQGAGNDYTISGVTITMLTGMIPVSTDVLLVNYRY